jgi:drug/metabolite transporter (DMT)-like permease
MTVEVQERRPVAGTAGVLIAVSVWGGVGVVVRFVEDIDGLVVGFHRLWIGALATLAAFYATGRRLSWRTLRLSVPGGIAFACDIVLFFSALKHTTVANATVVGALQPALVLVVAGPLFGERITKALVAATVVAVGGVALVVYGSADEAVWSPVGDLLAVAALLSWTAYFVASRHVRRVLGSFEYLTGMIVVATVAVAPVALLSGQRLDPGGPGEWAWIALLAIGSGGFGHLLLNWAHDHVDLSVMSLLTLAVPVVAVITAALFLDEPLSLVQVAGMGIVVLALAAVVRGTSVPAEPPYVVDETQ